MLKNGQKSCRQPQNRHRGRRAEGNCRSIKVSSGQYRCWGRGKMITMNETEYLNTCEYGPHYVKMVHTMAARSNFALTSSINIQLSCQKTLHMMEEKRLPLPKNYPQPFVKLPKFS